MHKDLGHRANKHHEAHELLKEKVRKYKKKQESTLPIFVNFFIISLIVILALRNWGHIIDLIQSKKTEPKNSQIIEIEPISGRGSKTAIVATYRIDNQAHQSYRNLIASINPIGIKSSVSAHYQFGSPKVAKINENALKDSAWLTNYLSTGQQLTSLAHKQAKLLQKSIISTYYLGERTITINSTLKNDSKILSQIKNTLSVDLFQYLNQSINRADALDDYNNLLNTLLEKGRNRSRELNAQVVFLRANSNNKNQQIELSQEAFFNNISLFDGENAENELSKFIGLEESKAEINAKLGAYESLKGYYDFFIPQIEGLLKEIKLNREAIIAGVQVTEIRDMQLPIIIQER